ncbi:MAG: Ribosomal RNA small subunit methyltransferase E (EC [uncultured Sulfurovum sp.]|uniref:Ribosomal RNA small subunit methyltransferase E n=1 Tax=uncultured Sulfurovum sp. TaxID=269237 RepID=A0A6S6SBP8_9BACT|nr:MAG: Ribosomal RNA small subunit methyltransferase E (EC [uncultured Sulfurovum sp.]
MQYLFVKEAGVQELTLEGDEHRYIFKVRRHREGETIALRNLLSDALYFYKIVSLSKKEAMLSLEKSEILSVIAKKKLHLLWCVIDPKSVEKVLPSLNEMGVDAITFVYCSRSQKSFKVDFKRLEKILLNSSQQCGRSSLMKLSLVDSIELFLEQYPNTIMLNFSEQNINDGSNIESIFIGCEGGFTAEEEALFKRQNIRGLDSPLILKSESAVCAVASKLLL